MGMARTRESIIYLDTHVACWLYDGRTELLSPSVAERIASGRLFISPMVELELYYLHEVGKITETPDRMLSTLEQDMDLRVTDLPLVHIVKQARLLNWTRDPLDRLIVAEVMLVPNAVLVTRDRNIRTHCDRAVW